MSDKYKIVSIRVNLVVLKEQDSIEIVKEIEQQIIHPAFVEIQIQDKSEYPVTHSMMMIPAENIKAF